MREKLAALSHEQWSGWMEYLFSKCKFHHDGSWTIPNWAVARWGRQMKTSYEDLSEEEKESDRKEADKFIILMSDTLTGGNKKEIQMEEYQRRVISEKVGIDENLKRLNSFLAAMTLQPEQERPVEGHEIDLADIELLQRQSIVMAEYSRILGERINNFK